MRKQIIILVLVIMLATVVTAQLPQCNDEPQIGQNCVFVTPPIVCSDLHYNITNMNGDLIENGSLSNHSPELDLYQFNFTLTSSKADYQITLCEGTFREIYVGGGTVTPAVVTGQLFFLGFISLITLILLFVASREEDAVLGFLGSAGLFIIGWQLLSNPFVFLTGQATFIGLSAFGLGIIVIGLYFLLNSVNIMFIRGKKGIGKQD